MVTARTGGGESSFPRFPSTGSLNNLSHAKVPSNASPPYVGRQEHHLAFPQRPMGVWVL